MIPILKTEKGWLIQVNPAQLQTIRKSCLAGRMTMKEVLLLVRGLTPESRTEIESEIKELTGIIESIDRSLKAVASSPGDDYTLEVELPPQVQL